MKGCCVSVEVPDPQCKVSPANAALLLQRWYLQNSKFTDCISWTCWGLALTKWDGNISSLAVMELICDWLGGFSNQVSFLVRCWDVAFEFYDSWYVCSPSATCSHEVTLACSLCFLDWNSMSSWALSMLLLISVLKMSVVWRTRYFCATWYLYVEDALEVVRIDQKCLAPAGNFFLVSCVRINRVWAPFSLYGRECADQIVVVVNSAHGYLVSWQIWHWEYLDCCLPQGKGGRCDPWSTTTHPSHVTWVPNLWTDLPALKDVCCAVRSYLPNGLQGGTNEEK